MDSFNIAAWMPLQRLSFNRKNKNWRISCVEAMDNQFRMDYNDIRTSEYHKKINVDLMNGHLNMSDLELLLNPDNLRANFISDKIQHYDTIGPKLNVLRGEELKRIFDFKVICTNPNSITEIENNKKLELFEILQNEIQDLSLSEEDFLARMEKLNDYYTYEWLDLREVRANCLINHYVKEYNMPLMFNEGFMDALSIAEEIYLCDIIGGEPIVEKLNPRDLEVYMSGHSNKIEDADRIVICDYWLPGKILDTYYDVLTASDVRKIEEMTNNFATGNVDECNNWDERKAFVNGRFILDDLNTRDMTADDIFNDTIDESNFNRLAPTDSNGNIRVLRVYWKSERKIKKVKFYDPETGEEDFTFMPEGYIPNESMGEEVVDYWVNEAWEGTKIGKDIYVNIRPRPILYNRLSNPSRCHFGIVGSIYNFGDLKPFSMVDRMKPYVYLYDVIHDRLNKMMARNWGKMTRLNLALKPNTWDMDKWLYYAKTMGLFVEDGFNEGNIGRSTGVMAGSMNMNSTGVIDADFGNNIQLYINLLEYIKAELSDTAGISKQREGLISNRETVGGVERATLLSSHITEWLFSIHDDVKRRTLEVFLETAKGALKGRSKKFLYIMSDYSTKVIDIDGDEFAEADYGLIVDNSNGLQELQSKLETLAQAALQNLTLSFSTIMKLFMSASIAEKQRFVENDERRIKEEQQLILQQLMLLQLLALDAQMLDKQAEREFKDMLNKRDNDTRIMLAEINSLAEMAILQLKNHMTEEDLYKADLLASNNKEKLMNDMLLMDKKLKMETLKLEALQKLFNANLKFLLEKAKRDLELKLKLINKTSTSKSK